MNQPQTKFAASAVQQTKPVAKLTNWYVQCFGPNEQSEHEYQILFGTVSGHNRLPDGADIHSSKVVNLDLVNKRAETLNTIYELGEPRRLSV